MKYDVVLFDFALANRNIVGTKALFGAMSFGPIVIGSHFIRNGYTVKVVNGVNMFTEEQFASIIDTLITSEKQVVAFSLTYVIAPSDVARISGIMKRCSIKFPKINYLFGGPSTNAIPFKPGPRMHFAIGQDAEDLALSILNKITKSTNEIVPFDYASYRIALDKIYTPPYQLAHMGFVDVSKHCIFNCPFCSYPNRGQHGKLRNADAIVDSIEQQHSVFGVNNFFILCNTFNDYVSKFDLMVEVSNRLSFTPQYMSYIRIDLFTRQKTPAAHEFYSKYVDTVHLGIESFNSVSLKAIKKDRNVNRLKNNIVSFKKMYPHIKLILTFVMGLPGYKKEDINEVFDWLIETNVASVVYIMPLQLRQTNTLVDSPKEYSDFELSAADLGFSVIDNVTWANEQAGLTSDLIHDHIDEAVSKYRDNPVYAITDRTKYVVTIMDRKMAGAIQLPPINKFRDDLFKAALT